MNVKTTCVRKIQDENGEDCFVIDCNLKCGDKITRVCTVPVVLKHDSESDVDPADIKLVMAQTQCTRKRAIQALKELKGDLLGAILDITDNNKCYINRETKYPYPGLKCEPNSDEIPCDVGPEPKEDRPYNSFQEMIESEAAEALAFNEIKALAHQVKCSMDESKGNFCQALDSVTDQKCSCYSGCTDYLDNIDRSFVSNVEISRKYYIGNTDLDDC